MSYNIEEKKLYNRNYYIKNRNRILKASSKWRNDQTADIYKKMRDYYYNYARNPNGIYRIYKSNAKKRQIEFLLTLEQFLVFWQKDCYYCGIKIKTIGLDRVNSFNGYKIDNIVPCCSKCNYSKLKMSKEEYINHCKKIAERF
jgi:hypothetical protein